MICADGFTLSFELLHLHTDLLMQFEEANSFHDSMQGYLRDIRPVIEIYRASQTRLSPNEDVLNNINSWSRVLLKEEISTEPNSHEVLDYSTKDNLDICNSFIFMFCEYIFFSGEICSAVPILC